MISHFILQFQQRKWASCKSRRILGDIRLLTSVQSSGTRGSKECLYTNEWHSLSIVSIQISLYLFHGTNMYLLTLGHLNGIGQRCFAASEFDLWDHSGPCLSFSHTKLALVLILCTTRCMVYHNRLGHSCRGLCIRLNPPPCLLELC